MRERILRLRAELDKMDCDAFLVTNPIKVRYLTGFNSNESSFCLVTQQGLYLVVHKIYGEQATLEAGDNTEILIVDKPQDEISKIRELFKPYRRICFENDFSYVEYRLLKERRAKEDFFPVSGDPRGLLMKIGLVDMISAVKDGEEIQKIQKAVEITEKVLEDHVLPKVRPGVTEKNLAVEVPYWGRKLGAEANFDNIVLAGKRSSMPHGESSDNRLQEGDIVQFDLSHSVDGCLSDVSRAFILGEPTEKQRKIYNLVLTAQEAAIKAARPGMKCKDLDKIARNIIKNGGYDIPHALGHGLGISMDTFPGVGPEDETELRPGHVITVEPGIYIPGWGGIRIEDVIVITEDGCRNLNKFPKDLTIIPIPEDRHSSVRDRPFTPRVFR